MAKLHSSLVALTLLLAGCDRLTQPTLDMTGTYMAPTDRTGSSIVEIRFTGPGYCKAWDGPRGSMRDVFEGTCTLKNGGMEFAMGTPFGAAKVNYFKIESGALVNDEGMRLTKVE